VRKGVRPGAWIGGGKSSAPEKAGVSKAAAKANRIIDFNRLIFPS
jgi:hypothetical protein